MAKRAIPRQNNSCNSKQIVQGTITLSRLPLCLGINAEIKSIRKSPLRSRIPENIGWQLSSEQAATHTEHVCYALLNGILKRLKKQVCFVYTETHSSRAGIPSAAKRATKQASTNLPIHTGVAKRQTEPLALPARQWEVAGSSEQVGTRVPRIPRVLI